MHLAIFGASGRTGQLLTELALGHNHTVAALLRTPNNFPRRTSPGVRVIEGDAFNPSAIAETLKGANAVLSALGARSLRREDVLERAIPLIVSAMTLLASGALSDWGRPARFRRRWTINRHGSVGLCGMSYTRPRSNGPSRQASRSTKRSARAI